MRDVNRIDPFLEMLGEYWKKYAPDWRFMQFVCNLQRTIRSDGYYLEEKDIEEYLKKMFRG